MKVGNCFSNCASVGSGFPQGIVLGPLLFLLFMSDICDIFGDFLSVKLFADYLKVYVVIDSINKIKRLQNGLDKLGEWSEIWQINLSINKCLTLHVSEQNPMSSYCIRGLQLANVTETVDLGILVDTRLRFHKRVCNIVHKANQMAALIRRCFCTRDANVLMKAFTVYVRPCLNIAHLYGIPNMFAAYSTSSLHNDDLPNISLDLGTIHISLGCPN